jgi:membrane protein
LYKILPSAKILWEPTFVGAAVTTLLFFIGIWLIWNFVIERDLDDIYDIAASIIVVALWVFYSSLVFLYGASFTKVYAKMRDKQIAPLPYTFKYDIVIGRYTLKVVPTSSSLSTSILPPAFSIILFYNI